ncbi:hypothetical protein [Aeromonas hydrophila]|uniref:hypothetical protein n=1 Tax=Aeromonas hydrophila TaxID=644 RepID=UPI003EC781AD
MSVMIEISYNGIGPVDKASFEPLAIALVCYDPSFTSLTCNANFYGYERSLKRLHDFVVSKPRQPLWMRLTDSTEQAVVNCHIAHFRKCAGPLVILVFDILYGPMAA